ncbi:hypothetical protein EB73_07205 [Mycobacterium sp. SWH-M3]|nr:hypothetical protein EB73_07205 [Mycobacterium sp. SWH-M3]
MNDTINARAHSFGALRACRHTLTAITYRATLETTGTEAVEAILTALTRAQLVETAHDGYVFAVLDIVDEHGAIIDDRALVTESAFEHIRSALGLRVTGSGCAECEPVSPGTTE